MKLFQPELHLTQRLNSSQNWEYYLYALTFFDTSKYINDGNETFSSVKNSSNVYKVDLKVTDGNADLGYLTPIVHTLPLGELTTPFTVEVSVWLQGNLVGKSIIRDEQSDDDGKPVPRSN